MVLGVPLELSQSHQGCDRPARTESLLDAGNRRAVLSRLASAGIGGVAKDSSHGMSPDDSGLARVPLVADDNGLFAHRGLCTHSCESGNSRDWCMAGISHKRTRLEK